MNRGRQSHRKISEATWQRVHELLTTSLAGFSPTHAAEKLDALYNISMSDESLRTYMKQKGLFIRARRSRSPYRSKRPRKLYFGQMIQLDGSYHAWFKDCGPRCTLIAFIDDATSKITSLHFAEAESTSALYSGFKQHIERYGIPISLYSDRHSVYPINDKVARANGAQSQFQQICGKLNVELIHANTPQAKGRVERLFRFLEDRLISELTLPNISSIQEANIHLPALIDLLNERYAKTALGKEDVHRCAKQFNLTEILNHVLSTTIGPLNTTINSSKFLKISH